MPPIPHAHEKAILAVVGETMQADTDWERLRSRKVKWELIPADSRELVVPYLSVQDNLLGLNVALTTKKDKLREELEKSYEKAVIPAFDAYCFTNENNFAGLRWVIKKGIDLRSLTLSLNADEEAGLEKVTERDEVLWCLVDRKIPDMAALYITKSQARDTSKHSTEWNESLSTLWIAASNGYAPVVRALIDRGADINKVADNGVPPLFIASENGHVDVVHVLLEQGADIDKAYNHGVTPLYALMTKCLMTLDG